MLFIINVTVDIILDMFKWYPSKENHNNLLTKYRGKFYNNIKKL